MRNEAQPLHIHHMGRRAYEPVWHAMRDFTAERRPSTVDEFWLVEHPSVFTLGQAGQLEHVLAAGDIPVVRTDRGGQVTYHGPGQIVLYTLIDMRRRKLGVRTLVDALELSVIRFLSDHGISAESRPDAPGVYVQERKIASLGLRIRRGCSYHGLAFNLDMDLEPFNRINPCGFPGLGVTCLSDFGVRLSWHESALALSAQLADILGYRHEI